MKTKPKKPLRGKPLLRAAWNFVAEHPEKWKQESACCVGGCGCFVVHASNIAHSTSAWRTVYLSELKELGQLGYANSDYLFNPNRTMPELRARVVRICGARGLLPVPKGYE